MDKIIYTPAQKLQVIHKVKDSKFYGSIANTKNEDEVKQFITRIKENYHDATHNVSAYKLGSGDQAVKYCDDDGEPAGSSGPPVLQAIEGEGLTNTVIVVTRYFGGTKLGIGGLIRAYGDTARKAISESGRKEATLIYKLMVAGDYNLIGTIMGQIEAHKGKILTTDYNNSGGKIYFLLYPRRYESFKNNVREMTADKITINKVEEFYM